MKGKMASARVDGQAPPGETTKSRYDTRELFRGQREILIEHAGHAYHLRITRQDKLILTK
jgi:hemin uptake protein HemP